MIYDPINQNINKKQHKANFCLLTHKFKNKKPLPANASRGFFTLKTSSQITR